MKINLSNAVNVMNKTKVFLSDMLLIALGSAIYSFGVVAFLQPLEISPGGVTGIATVVNYLSGFPTGAALLLLNLPLLILGLIKLGGKLIAKTIVSTVLSSVFIDIFSIFFSSGLTTDRIIAALASGVCVGVGMSMLFLRGATSGGTDIAAKLINNRNPFFPIGRIILIIDGVVITLAAIAYRDMESALYSVLTILISTTIIDKSLYSAGGGKVAFIITDSPKELKIGLLSELGRGVSQIAISGGYSGKPKTMLICALRRQQITELHRIIKETDKNAFVIITEAGEIMGCGFSPEKS